MNRPGNSPQQPPNKPFQIPGPYSSSGMFDPGTANILESIRLGKLREAREQEERERWAEQQAYHEAHGQWQQPTSRVYQHTAPPQPKQRNILVRLVLGLLKLTMWAIVIIIALAVLAAIFG